MIFVRTPGSRPAGYALLAGAIFIAGGILGAWEGFYAPHQKPISLTAAAERTGIQAAGAAGFDPAASPIRIEVDASQTASADEKLLQNTLDSISRLAGPVPGSTGAQGETESAETVANWQAWGRLQQERAQVNLPGASSEESVSVYAVHSKEGATVVLCNHTRQKTLTLLRTLLPAGVYKIDRLSFSPPIVIADEESYPARLSARCAPEGANGRLDRLEGGDLASRGPIEKPLWLTPEQVCLIRYTDVAYQARAAFYQSRDRLKTIRASAPNVTGRLSAVFHEGEPYISGLTAGGRRTLEKRLGCVHRLLLLTAQAHSLHHNAQERKNIDAEAGAALMGEIERLNDALTETSAALLGLVPQISLTLDPIQAAQKPENGGAAPGALPEGQKGREAVRSGMATITLANTGSRSVNLVKIGLDVSALPMEVRCEPGDPAMFGTLHPGQTVRATFLLRWPADASLTDRRCAGEVSYFVANAPAHLRLRPW